MMEFGFFTKNIRVVVDGIEIKPLADHGDKINKLYKKANVLDGWFYPWPIEKQHGTVESKKYKKNPYITPKYFDLLPTHTLTIYPYDEQKVRFLILAFGFLNGLYLSPAGHYYLNRIAIEPYKLLPVEPDFQGKDLEKGMHFFSTKYDNLNDEQRKQVFAIMHWFLIGQSYDFPWDRFDAQYKVLDAIYKFSNLNVRGHSQRPVVLANTYGVKIPDWAVVDSTTRKSKLSIIRNDFIHQALYEGEPIGYKLSPTNFDLEFPNFNLKLFLGALGLNMDYIKIEPNDRQRHQWDFN